MVVQQNRKSPSTVLTAHNSTGSRTFMCNILKKDTIHKQIVATAKRLRSEEDYDLAESYVSALKKRKFLLERILDNYEMPNLSTTEELPGTTNAK